MSTHPSRLYIIKSVFDEGHQRFGLVEEGGLGFEAFPGDLARFDSTFAIFLE
jgi:hypothetical protein